MITWKHSAAMSAIAIGMPLAAGAYWLWLVWPFHRVEGLTEVVK